jgi:hypothetical protein
MILVKKVGGSGWGGAKVGATVGAKGHFLVESLTALIKNYTQLANNSVQIVHAGPYMGYKFDDPRKTGGAQSRSH